MFDTYSLGGDPVEVAPLAGWVVLHLEVLPDVGPVLLEVGDDLPGAGLLGGATICTLSFQVFGQPLCKREGSDQTLLVAL